MATEWRWGGGTKVLHPEKDGLRSEATAQWRLDVDHFTFDDELSVCMPSIDIRAPFVLNSHTTYIEPRVKVVFRFAGHNELLLPDGVDMSMAEGQILILAPVEHAFQYTYSRVERLDGFEIFISPARLSRYIGDAMPVDLHPFTRERTGASRAINFHATPEMKTLAAMIRNTDLSGSLKKLQVEGFVLSLLALIGAQLGGHQSDLNTRRDRDAAMEAYQIIVSDLSVGHTVGSLAADVNISERRLSRAFQELFKMSIFQKQKVERLQEARRLLESDHLKLKQIAHQVGYAHVANFVRAFSAHYHAPPRRLTR